MEKVLFYLISGFLLMGLYAAPVFAADGVGVIRESAADVSSRADAEQRLESEWGTASGIVLALNPFVFQPWRQADASVLQAYGIQRYCTAGCYLEAQVNLPSGASVYAIELDAYDANESGYVESTFAYCPYHDFGCSDIAIASTPISEAPGNAFAYTSLSTPHTIDNYLNTYIVEVALYGGTSATRLTGFRVYYNLQVSPAPATATFTDVPTTHPFFQYIEALADSGITSGCSATEYCPDAYLTRGQMAVFLSRALGLHWPN